MKDQFHVKGMGTTMGYVGWIDSFEGDKTSDLKCRAESELVRKLESLGAIVIAKTTLVQSVWYWETNNNILGYHRNPRSQGLSSGGSSGGEGGTQAMRCSAVGFGTDIGGSVSMPAAFNGVFSIKPSAGRLPTKNMPNSSLGQINIPTVVGMLGPSIATLRHVFRALISSEPWNTDPSVLPIPWREPKLPAKLSFGFMEFEGAARPHPPVIRALKMAKAALEKAGHEVLAPHPLLRIMQSNCSSGDPVEGSFAPRSSSDPCRSHHPVSTPTSDSFQSSIVRADGNFDVFDRLALSGEPLIPELVPLAPTGKPQPPKTAIEVAQYVQRMMIYRARYQAYWQSTSAKTASGHPVDAVLLPVTTSAALIPGKPLYHEYITLVNVIDHATLVVPITRADETVDTFEKDYVPSEELDRKIWESCGRSNSFSCAVLILVDDPAAYNGAPAAIQVLAGRLDEEKLLAVGQVVVDAVREYGSS
ncbi:hypothetical protein OQA88_13183 [Cercophora sp. LCS_1]